MPTVAERDWTKPVLNEKTGEIERTVVGFFRQLPVNLSWAMTIHKSQGSEFDNVTVTITPNSRLLSKELFYTAITRAKKHVTVIAVEEDVRRAIESPARRFTGLFEALTTAVAQQSDRFTAATE